MTLCRHATLVYMDALGLSGGVAGLSGNAPSNIITSTWTNNEITLTFGSCSYLIIQCLSIWKANDTSSHSNGFTPLPYIVKPFNGWFQAPIFYSRNNSTLIAYTYDLQFTTTTVKLSALGTYGQGSITLLIYK